MINKEKKMSIKHIIGVFEDEFQLVKAVEEMKERKISIEEIYTPLENK